MGVLDLASEVQTSRLQVAEPAEANSDNVSKTQEQFYKSLHLPARKSSRALSPR